MFGHNSVGSDAAAAIMFIIGILFGVAAGLNMIILLKVTLSHRILYWYATISGCSYSTTQLRNMINSLISGDEKNVNYFPINTHEHLNLIKKPKFSLNMQHGTISHPLQVVQLIGNSIQNCLDA